MAKKLLGIDLGGTTVKFGILTSEGEVQEKWAIETNQQLLDSKLL